MSPATTREVLRELVEAKKNIDQLSELLRDPPDDQSAADFRPDARTILTTLGIRVTILTRLVEVYGDETCPRRRFGVADSWPALEA